MAIHTYTSASNTITLAWNANPEPDIAGYRLYWGTSSGVYPNNVDVHNVLQYTLSGVFLPNTIYYFALTAYNTNSQESTFSTEIATEVFGSIQMGGASVYTHHGSRTYAASGGMVVSGTPAHAWHHHPIPSGSMVMSGTASHSFSSGGKFFYTSSGSIIIGTNLANHARVIIPPNTGGAMTMGGTFVSVLQSVRSIYGYTSLGGMVTSGATTTSKRKVKSSVGGMTASGHSSSQFFSNIPATPQSYSYTSLGGMVISGDVGKQRSIIRSSDGGFAMGGTSNAFVRTFGLGSISYLYTSDGGIDIGGGSSLLITKAPIGDGGIVMGGTSNVMALLDQLENSIRFRIYKRDCEVRVKEFGQDVPYMVTNPFGGPSHDDPSGAEI